ncbi:thymus-specific serine protease isoform 2-T2 [Spinachia spinachia]
MFQCKYLCALSEHHIRDRKEATEPLRRVEEGRIHQQLDHLDRLDVSTFPQRFFVNEAFWRRADGPVFLYIGGEGPISESSVLAGHHVVMAEELGALLVALEHRFYGDSINPDGLKTENLSDLNSQQALADLAVFHQHISQKFNLSRRNTWISFGGSYAGALSAWFRGKVPAASGLRSSMTVYVQEDASSSPHLPLLPFALLRCSFVFLQFPHLVYAAVASSAPVRAKLDFSAYSRVVASSLANEAVGGSGKCLAAVREAFAAAQVLMGGNASRVAADFGCCQMPKNLEDQMELMQNLADIVTGTVQYNEAGGLMSINELCVVMTNTSEAMAEETRPYNRLVKLAHIYRSSSEEPCLDVSHEKTVTALMDTAVYLGRTAERQWTYQTCNEFGFYQTCEEASCPFSGLVTLRSQTELCRMLFGISQHSLPERVAFTNTYYGGDDAHTHRVLYVNGGVDPWKELSVVRRRAEGGREAQTVFIEDTAHCADMMSQRATDRRSLRAARQEIEEHVVGWLKMAAQEIMV